MNIHFGNPKSIETIADAVRLYGSKEFESATRSTVPMLALLMHALSLFDEIVERLGFPNEYDLYLEYTVGPFSGRGKPSHTDVMLTAGKDALAIEGKWTEPMYPAIKDWPNKGREKTANQKAVLNGWLIALGERLGKTFDVTDFGEAVYQMVHRAASAAFVGERPRLAYFSFKPSPDKRAARPDDILNKLIDLWNRLGKPAMFPFFLVEIETQPLEAYDPFGCCRRARKRQPRPCVLHCWIPSRCSISATTGFIELAYRRVPLDEATGWLIVLYGEAT
jgi:hypothetical protein